MVYDMPCLDLRKQKPWFIWILFMFLYYAETNKTCKVVNPKTRFLCMVRCDNWTETHEMWRIAKPEIRFSFMYFLPSDYIRKLGLSIMYYSPIPLFLYRKRYGDACRADTALDLPRASVTGVAKMLFVSNIEARFTISDM